MPSLDINIDINQLNAGSGAGDRRVHPGSDVPNAFVDHTRPVIPIEKKHDATHPKSQQKETTPYPEFYPYWNADLQSYTYLNEFLTKFPGWLPEFIDVALAENRIRPQAMTEEQLNDQVIQILNRVKDRGSRASEIINQDDAEGAISCWLNILGIDPVRNPATNLLVRVGRRIGEHVVMSLKEVFKSPRPSQLSLAINPFIDPPATPSFPAGHALQSYLISYLLADTLKTLPQHELTEVNPENAKGLLFDLAARISENRVIAGIHYPVDIEAGRAVAIACFKQLRKPVFELLHGLQAEVAKELKQYA